MSIYSLTHLLTRIHHNYQPISPTPLPTKRSPFATHSPLALAHSVQATGLGWDTFKYRAVLQSFIAILTAYPEITEKVRGGG